MRAGHLGWGGWIKQKGSSWRSNVFLFVLNMTVEWGRSNTPPKLDSRCPKKSSEPPWPHLWAARTQQRPQCFALTFDPSQNSLSARGLWCCSSGHYKGIDLARPHTHTQYCHQKQSFRGTGLCFFLPTCVSEAAACELRGKSCLVASNAAFVAENCDKREETGNFLPFSVTSLRCFLLGTTLFSIRTDGIFMR